jgi:isoleucyl-tRNA synthetase
LIYKDDSPHVGEYAGKYKNEYYNDGEAQNVDVEIAIRLKEENKASKVEKYVHSYPHCWRTDNLFCIIHWILGL